MQKIAILSDIHANLPALETVLREVKQSGAGRIVFLGDIKSLDSTRFHIPEKVPCAVMVGSVGQPLPETDLRAAWVLWDPVERVVEFRKTDYDRLQAAR